MSIKKKSQITTSMSIIKTPTSKRQKGDNPADSLSREFLQQLKSSSFRGLWMFGSQNDFEIWMDSHFNYLSSKQFNGIFFADFKFWRFPNGAKLNMQVLNEVSDLAIIKGGRFNFVSVSGSIKPHIQNAVLEYLENR